MADFVANDQFSFHEFLCVFQGKTLNFSPRTEKSNLAINCENKKINTQKTLIKNIENLSFEVMTPEILHLQEILLTQRLNFSEPLGF